MNSIIVNNEKLSKFKKLKTTINYESTIYTNNNILYKVLNEDFATINREENIDEMCYLSHPNCIFPKGKILNENNVFIGLYEDYLKGYKTIYNYFKNHNISLENRKEIAHIICQTQKYLESIKLSFIDLHENNIMFDGKNIKLIDLDSAEFIHKELSDVFEYLRKDLICKNLSITIYQILLGKCFKTNDIDKYAFSQLRNISNNKQLELLNKFVDKGNIIDVEEYIESFNEDYVEECKLILHI